MRTTITIDEHLLDQLRKRAAAENSTISRLISDAVRLALAETEPKESRYRFELVTFGKQGSGPLVDVNQTGRVLSMDDVRKLKQD